jgi:hypothetical protein
MPDRGFEAPPISVPQQSIAPQNDVIGAESAARRAGLFMEIHLTLAALPQQIKFNARTNNGL